MCVHSNAPLKFYDPSDDKHSNAPVLLPREMRAEAEVKEEEGGVFCKEKRNCSREWSSLALEGSHSRSSRAKITGKRIARSNCVRAVPSAKIYIRASSSDSLRNKRSGLRTHSVPRVNVFSSLVQIFSLFLSLFLFLLPLSPFFLSFLLSNYE